MIQVTLTHRNKKKKSHQGKDKDNPSDPLRIRHRRVYDPKICKD